VSDDEKVKATVYRERTPPATAIDQWRALEAETMEETNTERDRFMDFRERLSFALSLVQRVIWQRGEIDGTLMVKEKKFYTARMDDLKKDLKDARFPDKWAQTGEQLGLKIPEAAAYNYQVLNAKLATSLSDARALLIMLGVYPAESSHEAKKRLEMEAYQEVRVRG
jgi:hypothetical protein